MFACRAAFRACKAFGLVVFILCCLFFLNRSSLILAGSSALLCCAGVCRARLLFLGACFALSSFFGGTRLISAMLSFMEVGPGLSRGCRPRRFKMKSRGQSVFAFVCPLDFAIRTCGRVCPLDFASIECNAINDEAEVLTIVVQESYMNSVSVNLCEFEDWQALGLGDLIAAGRPPTGHQSESTPNDSRLDHMTLVGVMYASEKQPPVPCDIVG